MTRGRFYWEDGLRGALFSPRDQRLRCACLAWEAFHHHVLREQGQPIDVMGLVRNAGIAAGSIFAFPWLSVRLILFGNDLANGVVSVLGAQSCS